MSGERQVLDPAIRARIANLSLKARRAVEGVLSGVHRSPHRGASVVFVEHREYRPGDDLRLLDWRAYARSDRHTIKRFEQETQLRATLVLDSSASMDFRGATDEGPSKSEQAATLLAALGLVLVRQGDAAGVVRFARDVIASLPARSRPAHLELVLGELATPVEKEASTDLQAALTAAAERAGRRGVVAIASDLLDFGDHALTPIDQLVHRGHEVWVFQVMHPEELELPFDGPTRFHGLEGEVPLDVDPTALREGYLRELQAFLDTCRARCTAAGARYRLVRTDEPVERVLAEVLAAPGRRR
ncbi:DUF58 domain-containing protein [Sandaracinus amylolyticus]|uniref:DUF58 domain-containing protein n=1 Tax=Sandaracinus amylolyticus TaxID=927083 RepID=A0A0F6YI16_9BACT|nr:DUF58 domain-containing protein [Sandaracinus amylolyticus]AKF06226.1 hypothetical protein DB32_003375 [Sandaracinus amylolyticus]